MDLGDIRLKEHLGIITSDVSTSTFSFFVNPLKNKMGIGKGDFVILDHPVLGENYPLLAVVRDIRNYEEIVGATLNDRSIKIIATGEVLSTVDLEENVKTGQKPFVPPNPGSKVYLPYHDFLDTVFSSDLVGREYQHPLDLGHIESFATGKDGTVKRLKFYLDADDFRGRHFLVTGASGTGKTHVASVIVEELTNRSECSVVILDSFGEYFSVGAPDFEHLKKDGSGTKDYPFDFGVSVLAFDSQRGEDFEEKLRSIYGPSRLKVKSLEGEKISSKGKKELLAGLGSSRVVVVDISFPEPEEKRECSASILSNLWKARLAGEVGPFVLLVDAVEDLDSGFLERFASSGRKIGVSLCLATQHPSSINRSILSQVGTFLMGRTTDSDDLAYLKNVVAKDSEMLPDLRMGEWLVNGITVKWPSKVIVRQRYSVESKLT